MIETITHDGTVVALIIPAAHSVGENAIDFVTPHESSLQLGVMHRPAGYEVMPHEHVALRRETIGTQEVLFVRAGEIDVDLYTWAQEYLATRTLRAGDVIMLAGAGHGIRVIADATIVEVKNGPFTAGSDKGRFAGVRPPQRP